MGREVRRVPVNWNHPTMVDHTGRECAQPMFDKRFEDTAKKWKDDLAKWEQGLRPACISGKMVWQPLNEWLYRDKATPNQEWWEYEGDPPSDRSTYRPWLDAEATWFQVWETVTEGTPVTPPFATREELIDYLVTNGDFWDQKRRAEGRDKMGIGCEPWGRNAATKFVNAGWAPSMIMTNGIVTEVGGKPQ